MYALKQEQTISSIKRPIWFSYLESDFSLKPRNLCVDLKTMNELFFIFIFYCLSVVGSQRQQVQERNVDILIVNNNLQILLVDTKVFPGQKAQ